MRAISQYRIVYGMVISVDFPKRNRGLDQGSACLLNLWS